MHINLKHLRLFLAVAEQGSISAGAREVHVSQPAVTRQLMQLESRLGTSLFHRLPRGVLLTETGELLFDYAKRIFALANEAEKTVFEVEGLGGGELLLGASTTLGNYILSDVLPVFHQRYPRVRIGLEIANTDQIESLVESWTVTMGLVEGPPSSPNISSQVFMEDELLPVVGIRHRLRIRPARTPTSLEGPLLLRERGSGTRQVVESHLQTVGVEVKNRMYIGGTEAIKRLVASGMGIAWLPRASVAAEIKDGSLAEVPIEKWIIRRRCYRIQHIDSRLSNAARIFIQTLDELL